MRRVKNRSSSKDQHPYARLLLIGFIITAILCSIFLIQKANTTNKKIFQLNFAAVLLGLVFEYRRLSKKWSTVLWTALGAFVISLFAFSRSRGEHVYIYEDHLEMWPYFFLGAFVLISMAIQYSSATQKLNEGITLLLTIAFNYWIIGHHYLETSAVMLKYTLVLAMLCSLFPVYHALSYSRLGKGTRLLLSIWSSLITLILAANNFMELYQYRDIEHLAGLEEQVVIFLQFFLLGVSSIYLAQHLTMVAAYIPGKRYLETIREINDVHLKRFSGEQVYVFDAAVIIVLSLAAFISNYYFQWLPVNAMIWIVIACAPVSLRLVYAIIG